MFLPLASPVATSGRVHAVDVPPADLALTVHAGPHDDIDVTYGRLGQWVHERGLAIAGPVHETYLVAPRDTADERQWRTEIGWPVGPALDMVDRRQSLPQISGQRNVSGQS